MAPLLLINAVSAAGEIFHNIHTALADHAAKTAGAQGATGSFPALLDKAGAPAAATAVSAPVDPIAAQKTMATQLFHSTEVASAINQSGASGPMQLQIDATGSTSLRLADGSLKTVNFSPEMKATAQHLYQLQSAPAASAASVSHPVLIAQA